MKRDYLFAVALVAVLAVAFGLAGARESTPPQQQSYSEDSVTHYMTPPTFDSGWVDITTKPGQYIPIQHGLNTTEVVVDITGKQSLDPMGGAIEWSRTYRGTESRLIRMYVIQTLDGGYAMAGYTNSSGAGGWDFWLVKTDAVGNLQWNKTYGGTEEDLAYSVIQTLDGGYAMAGTTWSLGEGYEDFWLVKTDAVGNLQWNKTYGGTWPDIARSIVQTLDGGYALAGGTASFGSIDNFWLVKTNSTGHAQWNKTYGGELADSAYSMVQTGDGGYAIAGHTTSFGAGGVDFWLVKTNSTGHMQWNKTYGRAGHEWCYSAVQTLDGGYAMAGYTHIDAGDYDFFLVKTTSDGNLQWNKTYGGGDGEFCSSMVQTDDGGYALAGRTDSFGAGAADVWLVKTDSVGSLQWNKTYGGTSSDHARSMVQTLDGGYALAGLTESFGADEINLWLVKVKAEMNLEHQRNFGGTGVTPGWSRTYGGTDGDYANSMVQTFDGGYALAGGTESFGAGGSDFWLVKTDGSGNLQWNKTYGGISTDSAQCVVQTLDGGYAMTGWTNSFGEGGWDFMVVKTDSSGNLQWNKTYGGTYDDMASSLVQTSDGGYALAGYTVSYDGGYPNFWLVKTDSSGNALWNKTYRESLWNFGAFVVQTFDGGYALAGYTGPQFASYDLWLVKTDSAGNAEWNATYGGANNEIGGIVIQTIDGGYALAGSTSSYGVGHFDCWLVKTDSAGNAEWNATYGGANAEYGAWVIQTTDGGYALAGVTESFGAGYRDCWLVKIDYAGTMLWDRVYGGAGWDEALTMVQTSDGGYALAGHTDSFGAGSSDFWLIKTDVEAGLAWTGLANYTIILYRGRTDPYWNFVRVRIWSIKKPTWQYGDITGPEGVPDGVVDGYDLTLACGNYGKTYDGS